MSGLEQAQAELKRRQLIAQAQAIAAGRSDSMGFPVAPQGGSAVNQQAVDEFEPKLRAAIAGGVNGASLGFFDEATGLVRGVQGALTGQGYTQPYRDARDAVRATHGDLQAQEPMAYGGWQIMGAAVPAIAAAPMATGGTGLATVARGAGIGAAEGALQGAGMADGQGVGRSALRGGAIGALIGAGAPVAVGAAGAVKNVVKDPATGIIDALLKRGNVGKANRAISSTMRASGQTPDQIGQSVMRAAQEGQPEFRMMDAMGLAGQRRASGVTRSGGDAAEELAQFLQSRQSGQGERVGGFVDDAFGTKGTTAAKTADALTAARRDAANTAYDAARGNAAPVDIRGTLGVIDDRIGGMQGSGVSGDGIDGKLAGYRSRLAAQPGPDGVSRELSDFDRVLGVKQSIQDDIGAAVRAGRNNEARELGKVMSELDAALEGSSDMYRAANDGFRDASRTIDAVGEGSAMSARGRAADNVPAFQGMTPDQQGAARVGYGDDLLRRIEANTAPTANKAKILQSPKRDAEAGAMTLDPDLYGRRLSRENDMWEAQNRALGGSRTADNLEDISSAATAAGGVLEAGRSAANFQFGDAVSKIAAMLGPVAKGQNEQTRQLIARALMSSDPQAALAHVLRQEMTGKQRSRIIEAIMRQPAQAASSQ